MKYKLCYVLISFSFFMSAQTTFEFNALLDTELSVAGSESHYYFNEFRSSRRLLYSGV